MKTAVAWRAAAYSHPGLAREINEDRVWMDEARGLFLVVDGLGGHAAGEVAAETALRVIQESLRRLESDAQDVERQLQAAIAAANNQIYELAQTHPEYHGMACVLTLAVASADRVIVGHVGDSRLYLSWNGKLRKLTSDHSPVGQVEDQGLLTEKEAMVHPRRNEVFRDVGTAPREPGDPDFVEIRSFLFRSDAALLLCSDGLSDYVPSTAMNEIVERFDGEASKVTEQLVEAANAAGGHDNISVVFVAGPEFLGTEAAALHETRARHATTRMRSDPAGWPRMGKIAALFLLGLVGGLLLRPSLNLLAERFAGSPAAVKKAEAPAPRLPQVITVNHNDALGIMSALAAAQPGDTISIPPGEYLGPLQLKDRVNLVATAPRQAVLRSDPSSSPNAGVALAAQSVAGGRISGLRIVADETHPLRVGMLLVNSSIEINDSEISGAADSGIRIEGDSHPLVLGNFVHGNPGTGITIQGTGAPRLVGNRVVENGPPETRIDESAHAVLQDNVVTPESAVKKKTAVVKARPGA